MRRPIESSHVISALACGALGAPIVYLALSYSQRSGASDPQLIVIVAAFCAAYLFSLAVTGFCVSVSLIIERKWTLSPQGAWALATLWPFGVAALVAAWGGYLAGRDALLMGLANLLVIFAFANKGGAGKRKKEQGV